MVKIFVVFNANRRFIAVPTKVNHGFLSWARWSQSASSHNNSLISDLNSPSVLHPGLQSSLLPVLRLKFCHFFSCTFHAFYTSRPSHSLWFGYFNNAWWKAWIAKHFIMQYSLPFLTSSLTVSNILLDTLFWTTFGLCSSIRMRDQVSNS